MRQIAVEKPTEQALRREQFTRFRGFRFKRWDAILSKVVGIEFRVRLLDQAPDAAMRTNYFREVDLTHQIRCDSIGPLNLGIAESACQPSN
jgi:hypothetical protein